MHKHDNDDEILVDHMSICAVCACEYVYTTRTVQEKQPKQLSDCTDFQIT